MTDNVVNVAGYTRRKPESRLVGITGFARAGKDTFAAGMVGWRRVSIADKLREVVEAIDPWIPIEIAEQKGVPTIGQKPVKIT